jgi:hypothetical protein
MQLLFHGRPSLLVNLFVKRKKDSRTTAGRNKQTKRQGTFTTAWMLWRISIFCVVYQQQVTRATTSRLG